MIGSSGSMGASGSANFLPPESYEIVESGEKLLPSPTAGRSSYSTRTQQYLGCLCCHQKDEKLYLFTRKDPLKGFVIEGYLYKGERLSQKFPFNKIIGDKINAMLCGLGHNLRFIFRKLKQAPNFT